MATCRTFVCWAVYLLVLLTASVASSYVSPLAESREHGRTRRHLFTHIRQDELQLSHRPTTTQHIQVPNDTVEDYTSHEASDHTRGKREAIRGHVHVRTITLGDNNPSGLVHWTGKEKSDVIIFLTYDRSVDSPSHLYVSRNYGASFTHLRLPLPRGTISRASHLQATPVAKDWYILADTVNNLIWTSKDDMLGVSLHELGFQPHVISTHPFNKNVVIIVNQNADGSWELHKSDDFCQTFSVIAAKVKRFFWGSGQSYEVDNTIYVETSAGVLRTDDYFATSFMIGPKGFDLLVQDRHVVFLTHEQNNKYATLMISYENGAPKASTFPDVTGKGFIAKEYFVADILEDSVLVCVNHYTNLTNLYISEYGGTDFSLSLERVLYHNPLTGVSTAWLSRLRSDKFIDWHIIAGFPSVIITTQLDPGAVGHRPLATVMTYDKGGVWDVLPAPSTDYKGKATNCEQATCNLHLSNEFRYSSSSETPKIFSTESAPGLIMANGNLGVNFLSPGSRLHFVMSADNGLSWKLLHEGAFHFASGDHGGILAAVQRSSRYGRVVTNAMRFSIDGGNTWKDAIFSQTPLLVSGFLTEPGEHSSVFTIFGYFASGSHAWSVINIDMKNAFKRTCEAKDFFLWRPRSREDYEDVACLQGRTEYIQLRKPSSICFNGLEFKRPRNTTTCQCTREDYYCDVGYKVTSGSVGCLPVKTQNAVSELYQSVTCKAGEMLKLSKGYRRVPGTACTDGELFEPVTVPCSSLSKRFGQVGEVSVRIFDGKHQDVTTGRVVTGSTVRNRTLRVYLAASVSTGYSPRVTWYFGDGSSIESETDEIVAHNYAKSGTYSIMAVAKTLYHVGSGLVEVETASLLPDDLSINVVHYGSDSGMLTIETDLLFTASFPNYHDNQDIVYHWMVCTGLTTCVAVAAANTSVGVFRHTVETQRSYKVTVVASGLLNSVSASINIDFKKIGKVQVFVEAASSTALSVGWSSTHTDAVVRITATPTSGGSAVVHYAPYWANSYTVTGLVSGGVYRVDVTAVLENMEFRALVPTRTIHLPSTEEIKSQVEINPSGTAVLHWQDLRQQLNPSGAYLVKATTPFLTASRRISAGSSAAFGGVTPQRNYYLFLSVHPISSRGEVQAAITYVSPYVTALGDFLLPPANLQAKQINASATLVTWEYDIPEVKEFQVTIQGVEFGLRTQTVSGRLAYLTRLSPEQVYTVTVSPLCLAARTSCKPMPRASINIHQKTVTVSLRAVRDLETQPFSADTVIVTWKLPTKLDEAIKGFRVFVSDQLPVPESASLARYTQRCLRSAFDVPKCLVDKLVAGVAYAVKVEVIAANSTFFPSINTLTEPEVFRIPQYFLDSSTVSAGRVVVRPKHEIATAMTTILWEWAASTKITIAVSGSSEGPLVYSVLPSQQQLDVLLFPSTTYNITVTSATLYYTLSYQTPSVSALPHLGVFWNALSATESNTSAASIRREFPVVAAKFVTENLLEEDIVSGNTERLAGGTFIGRHYYIIVDSVLDEGVPPNNGFSWYSSSVSSIWSPSTFLEPLVFGNKTFHIKDFGRMQWVDMLRDVDEGFSSASSTSRNANLYKHILVVLGVACAVVCVLLLVTLTVFCKTRRRYRRLTSGVGSVVYQSRLVSHDARGDRVMSTTSISMDSAGDDEPLLRPSVLDCDNDDDDVSLLSS